MNYPTANIAAPVTDHESIHGRAQSAPELGLGLLYLLAVPVSAGLAIAGKANTGGFNYTGWIWVAFLIVGALLVMSVKALDRDSRISFPYRPWLFWFGYGGLSLAWCDNLGVRNVQDLAQISMPLVVGIAASLFVTTVAQLKLLLRMFGVTLLLVGTNVIGARLGLFGEFDTLEGIRPIGLTSVLVGCVFLAGCPNKLVFPILMWGVCVLIATLSEGRMATIILLLLPILHPLLRGWKWRILAVAAMAGLSLALFYTPLFQERFFYDGSGTLTELFQGQIRGSGRVEAWPLIWQEAWNRPFLGHGVGTTYAFVPTVWDGMNHVQNDFLRIGYELGLVGLASFLAVMIWQIRSLWKRMNQSEGTVRIAAAAALLGIFAFLVGSWTGNTLVYNLWYMSPLFAVMGAVYGVSSQTIDH